MPYSYAGYAKFGYATWLCQIRLRRLLQIPLRHMVMPHTVTPVMPNSVTPHGYATYGVRAGGEKL